MCCSDFCGNISSLTKFIPAAPIAFSKLLHFQKLWWPHAFSLALLTEKKEIDFKFLRMLLQAYKCTEEMEDLLTSDSSVQLISWVWSDFSCVGSYFTQSYIRKWYGEWKHS